MNFALGYLAYRFFYRIGDFFHHWYIDGSRRFGHSFISSLETLDDSFAVLITLNHFFEPLYGDYSVIGRILGVIFRTGRVIVGASIYAVLTAIFLAAYLVWLLVPIIPLFNVATHLV